MSALAWIRAARKAVGLPDLPTYPNLEALLAAEHGEPDDDYRTPYPLAPRF